MYVAWLIQAKRLIKQAEQRELGGDGIQFITFWGQTKHWTEWNRIWNAEKIILQRKYGLAQKRHL